jgi:lipopolysaccharide biosynthesis protein
VVAEGDEGDVSPRLVRLSLSSGEFQDSVQLPLLGRTLYRIEAAAPVELRPVGSVTLSLTDAFRAPRVLRRFEASSRIEVGGVALTPLAFGGARDASEAADFMREIRAMRELKLYPVRDLGPAANDAPSSMPQDAPPLRVAVVVHLHYSELWPELAAYVGRVPGPIKLFVTVTAQDDELSAEILCAFPGADIRQVENRGYDIAPFLMLLNEGAFDGVDLVCKVHGKKSARRDGSASLTGTMWRRASFHSLLSNPAMIMRAFESDPTLGLAGPARFRIIETGLGRYLSMRRNRRQMIRLARLMGVAWYRVPLDFFAGCMFWVRPEALAPLRQLDLQVGNFAVPSARRNGTLAHVVERLFNVAARQAGFRVGDLP